jgi:hypothetical protein
MTHPYRNEVVCALFFIALAKEKLQPVKEAAARDALARTGKEESPEEIAIALEKAIYADSILRAFIGCELIEETLKGAAKLHGSLKVEGFGPLIGVQIKAGSDLTDDELKRMLPKEAMAGPENLLAALLGIGGNHSQCQCPKCQAKRSGG